jgi:phenylacetate-CoA ligase
MYGSFVKHISFPFYEWWHDSDQLKNLRKNMRSFERSQWFAPEQLKAIQWVRLKKLLYNAYRNVSYYQEKFKELGAVPDDIKAFEDYAKFPTLTKQTLQERLQDLIASNVPLSELCKGITSGSSGQPTFYFQERSSNIIRKAAGRRLSQIAGYDFGLKIFSFWRNSPFVLMGDNFSPTVTQEIMPVSSLEKIKKMMHDRFGVENRTIRVDPTMLTESEMAKLYNRLKSFHPDIIISYVNALYIFAQYLDSEHLTGIRPRSVIVSSETLYQHQRDLMEKVFGCPVYNRYGLQETGIVAIECPVRQGLHLNQEILHVEYIPTTIGNLQLVVTDLINYGMPLLRYETGDTGRPLDGPCPCGRGLSRVGEIEGRVIDLLPTQRGGYVNGQLFATFHWIDGIRQYQVVQEKIDSFKIRIVRTPAFKEKNLVPMLNTIREKFGSGTSVEIEYVDSIPFTKGGKYKLVVSEVKKDCV